jgi:DNA polymerase-1
VPAPKVFLIDTYGFIFRAYHARARTGAPPMRTTAGISTEAVFIFSNMLKKLSKTFDPKYMVAVFESLGKTHRETEYAEYKANRAETPPDLIEQIPYVQRLIEGLRIPVIQYPGFEADDVIGTLSRKAAEAGCEVVIVSSDKDMLQLVNDKVSMLNPAKDDTWYDPVKVKEFMGVEPRQVADLLALKGDAIDNIPGAPGIGDKGAKDLIEQFGSLEAALDRAAEVTRKTYRESLQNNRERILMSRKLATIDCNVPVGFDLESFRVRQADVDQLKPLYKELEFFTHLKELGPSEDTRTRDFSLLADASSLAAFVKGVPEGAPVSIAFSTELSEFGLACRSCEARSLPLSRLEELRGLLENPDIPKATSDLKTLTMQLHRRGVRPAGFQDDVSLYGFLLDSDPGSCSLDIMVERRLSALRSRTERASQAGGEAAQPARSLSGHGFAAGGGSDPHGGDGNPRRRR